MFYCFIFLVDKKENPIFAIETGISILNSIKEKLYDEE